MPVRRRHGAATPPCLLCRAARIAGIASAGFISLFALDAIQPGQSWGEALTTLAIHLVPSFGVVGVVVAAWRRPLIGGLLFVAIACLPFLLLSNTSSTNAFLAAPFAFTGLLFLACFARSHPRSAP